MLGLGIENFHICRKCGLNGPFYKSYVKRGNYLCKVCASAAVKESRARDPARRLAYRASQALGCHVATDFVKTVLERCEYKSIISGADDMNILCMVPCFREQPLEEWHCVIMTRYEARQFARLGCPEKMIPDAILKQQRAKKINE